MNKICFLSLPFPGVSRVGQEGAKLGFWDFVMLDKEGVSIPPADIFILGAYDPVYTRLINSLAMDAKVGICWTSSVGEMDFTPVEHEYLWTIQNHPAISFIWYGDPSLAEIFPDKGFYAPYPFSWTKIEKKKKQDYVSLFCPVKPSKNLLNHLLALHIVQRKAQLALHTNIQGYDYYLSSLNCVRHPWLPQDRYFEVLAGARLNLAVSIAETFSYQVVEAGQAGTPSIISSTIPLPGIKVCNINSPVEIADKILKYAFYTETEIPSQIQKTTEANNLKLVDALQKL